MRMQFANLHRSCIVAFAFAVTCCGPSKAPTAEATTAEAFSIPSAVPPPHRYDQEDHGTYYYIGSVSEEDQKKGKVAGDALGFRYLGKNERGEHIIEAVADNGTAIARSYCSEPCKVIREPSGRVGFNPASIIGAAFEDAINGHLRQFGSTNSQASIADPKAAKSGADSRPSGEFGLWLGHYAGSFEGGADGDLTISPSSGGRLKVSIGVGADSCTGGIEGSGLLSDAQLVLSKPRDDSGHQCRVTLHRRGDRIDVSEDGCNYFHGAFCSFNGSVRRR